MSKFVYCVITQVPEYPQDGNMADGMILTDGEKFYFNCYDDGLTPIGFVKHPVFEVGEILITDRSTREQVGHGRKPSKWWVGWELYTKIGHAIERSQQIQKLEKGEPLPSPKVIPIGNTSAEFSRLKTEMVVAAIQDTPIEVLLQNPEIKQLYDTLNDLTEKENERWTKITHNDDGEPYAEPYWVLKFGNGEITIEPRPPHCNRGRWFAKIFYEGFQPVAVSEQDVWPRYYFGDLSLAMDQCEQWLKAHESENN